MQLYLVIVYKALEFKLLLNQIPIFQIKDLYNGAFWIVACVILLWRVSAFASDHLKCPFVKWPIGFYQLALTSIKA